MNRGGYIPASNEEDLDVDLDTDAEQETKGLEDQLCGIR